MDPENFVFNCQSCKSNITTKNIVFSSGKVLCKKCSINDLCFDINALSETLEGEQKIQLLEIKKLALNICADVEI